jgi:hypothetical protein
VCRSTEIDDFDLAIRILGLENDVFWFHVSMDDVVLVEIQYCRQNLLHDVAGNLLSERTAFHDTVEQLSTLQVLSHDEEVFVILIKLENFDDIWMVLR